MCNANLKASKLKKVCTRNQYIKIVYSIRAKFTYARRKIALQSIINEFYNRYKKLQEINFKISLRTNHNFYHFPFFLKNKLVTKVNEKLSPIDDCFPRAIPHLITPQENKEKGFDPPSNKISLLKMFRICFLTLESHIKDTNSWHLNFLRVVPFGPHYRLKKNIYKKIPNVLYTRPTKPHQALCSGHMMQNGSPGKCLLL